MGMMNPMMGMGGMGMGGLGMGGMGYVRVPSIWVELELTRTGDDGRRSRKRRLRR
jgi:hypothetical protein